MSDVYGFMTKWGGTNLGQVFTPPHIAHFAAKLLEIKPDDVVLDSSAGSGALLLSCLYEGCKAVYGIEIDNSVFGLLNKNLALTGRQYEALNVGAQTTEAYDFIKSKPITKAILNPPYEVKYDTYGILLNTLAALSPGTKVVLIYPINQLEKNGAAWREEFLSKHTIESIIELPSNTFQPFASVSTAIFVLRAGVPHGDKDVFGCRIKDDGLVRQKNAFRYDKNGKWSGEYEPYWLKVVEARGGDESCTHFNPHEHGAQYYKAIDTTPTDDDFKNTVREYMAWKAMSKLKSAGKDEKDAAILACIHLFGVDSLRS